MRLLAALADDLGGRRHLAPHDALEAGPEPAQEAERMHAVADHQLAGREALEPEAVNFIARKSGHDRRHGRGPWLRAESRRELRRSLACDRCQENAVRKYLFVR